MSQQFDMFILIIICYIPLWCGEVYNSVENPYTDADTNSGVETVVVDEKLDAGNSSQSVDRSDEDWVSGAVLDVAYYLRSHKFNDFDRRYNKEVIGGLTLLYEQFPSPPLRFLHWEVSKNCDKDFYDCLSYLQNVVLKAALIRSMDTNFVMNFRNWKFPQNSKSIEKLNNECKRLKLIDWRDADPFKGPLERFQWRVSASYYMCLFTMQNLSPLIMFGERCDNFAYCLEEKSSKNMDPRADDSKPYQCAMYSFCPEVCCPLKKIRSMDECLDFEKNPCVWNRDRDQRTCTFNMEQNRDLYSMALNAWNVSCKCETGFEWQSSFGMCVDVDECIVGSHNCTPGIQSCINLNGSYGCVCEWGFKNVSGVCLSNNLLNNTLKVLHLHYHPPPKKISRPVSLITLGFQWISKIFFRTNDETNIQTSEVLNASEANGGFSDKVGFN